MMHWIRCWALGSLVLILSLPALAETSPELDQLIEALKVSDTIRVMQEEGRHYGDDLLDQLVPDADPGQWAETVARIYDYDKMHALITSRFRSEIAGADVASMLDYYQSEDGREIVDLEIAARRAFLDPEIEAEAAEHFADLVGQGAPVVTQIKELMKDSDLVERNVAGALNSDLMFYRGLTDGGAFDMTEEEMLAEVWGQEEDLRLSSRDWLRSFLLMAYEPLEPEQLDGYAAFYRTPEGQVLNAAIFAAFDQMYEEISYLLGLSVAQQMTSQKL